MKYLLLVFCLTLVSCLNNPMHNGKKSEKSTENTEKSGLSKPVIGEGFIVNEGNGNVVFTYEQFSVSMLPDGTYNITFEFLIQNTTTEDFILSFISFKLTDRNMVEVEESGVYDFEDNSFSPPLFYLTIVDAEIGKRAKVGYRVNKGVYFLSIKGNIIAEIPVE